MTELTPEESMLKAQLMELMRDTATAAQPNEEDVPLSGLEIAESASKPAEAVPFSGPTGPFVPHEPHSLDEAGLSEGEVEALVLKCLLNRGNISGRQITEQLCLPFPILERQLAQMKIHRLVAYKGDAALNDYQYELTDLGNDRARRRAEHCTYYGAAPVGFEEYCSAISAQTMTAKKPSKSDLLRAFGELVLSEEMFSQLGQALHAGKGLFLYGAPGNGKTSIAQRVTAAYGETMWIPRCISIFGEIIRLFDPSNHELAPLPKSEGLVNDRPIDPRWVRIKRPTIVVGGELTMDSLDIKYNQQTGIGEAPLHLKSNGGTFVIDDFGRQRISTDELLNRWIVPLETGFDFLDLASGRKIQVPFDQLIVFSTNLEPSDLVDEAFLRRIPYKLDVLDPTEEQFRSLFAATAGKLGIRCPQEGIDYLLKKHYADRPLRFCHPRDLLRQIDNFCSFHEVEPCLTRKNIDSAVKNYFGAISIED